MIIRLVGSEQEIEQALDVYAANEPSLSASDKTGTLAHWLAMYANCPEGFWIAEDESVKKIVGVASAVRQPPQWILANFYVLPAYQGRGIGRMLLSHAIAAHEGCDRFMVHSSTHAAAQSLYMQFGMYPLPHSIVFKGNPNFNRKPPDLIVENYPVSEILIILNAFDQSSLGFTRAVYHQVWASHGTYFLARQAGQVVAYFRVSTDGVLGPLIVSDERWMTAALELAILKQKEISTEMHSIFVPGANKAAIAYLIKCGYHYDEIDLLLSSHPMPNLAQVVFHDTDLL